MPYINFNEIRILAEHYRTRSKDLARNCEDAPTSQDMLVMAAQSRCFRDFAERLDSMHAIKETNFKAIEAKLRLVFADSVMKDGKPFSWDNRSVKKVLELIEQILNG